MSDPGDGIGALQEALGSGEGVAWCRVLERRGSLPMSLRARMLVHADGEAEGTVGGGCLEAEAYGVARRVLQDGGPSVDTYHLTEVEEGTHGHVCGGTVTLLTERMLPGGPVHRLLERCTSEAAGSGFVLAAALPDAAGELPEPRYALVVAGGPTLAEPAAAVPAGLAAACARSLDSERPVLHEAGDARWFLEPFLPSPHVVVFGAGHCGAAIARLAADTGFRVSIRDDRVSFADPERFPGLDVGAVDYEDALEGLPPSRRQYFVVVTRGHDHDLEVLRQLLPRPRAYLGMIGSERKRHLFFRRLREEGVPEGVLAEVRSPMGLPIAADTPEEIAVAVVAEMVAVRRGAELTEGSPGSSRRAARGAGRD